MKILFLSIAVLSLASCNSTRAKIGAGFSDSGAHITCFSGGKPIYDGESEGKPFSEQGSDGYFFTDKNTHALMEVSGQCVITYNKGN